MKKIEKVPPIGSLWLDQRDGEIVLILSEPRQAMWHSTVFFVSVHSSMFGTEDRALEPMVTGVYRRIDE